MKKDIGLYRIPTIDGPQWIHALEVKPGILMHPTYTSWGEWDWHDCTEWTLTHRETGRYLVENIWGKRFARRAAMILAKLRDHQCERHWLTMDPDYSRMLALIRDHLPFAQKWPEVLP